MKSHPRLDSYTSPLNRQSVLTAATIDVHTTTGIDRWDTHIIDSHTPALSSVWNVGKVESPSPEATRRKRKRQLVVKMSTAFGLAVLESKAEVSAHEPCEEGTAYRHCCCSAVGHENSLDPTVEFVYPCKVQQPAETANPGGKIPVCAYNASGYCSDGAA